VFVAPVIGDAVAKLFVDVESEVERRPESVAARKAGARYFVHAAGSRADQVEARPGGRSRSKSCEEIAPAFAVDEVRAPPPEAGGITGGLAGPGDRELKGQNLVELR
jgi:hypothetical protein